MKLSEYARQKGLAYKTVYRMYKEGKIPHPTEQLPTGTILVYPEQGGQENTAVLYARVSSNDQKDDLRRQLERLKDYAAKQGLNVSKEVTEIGSGLNGHRKNLLRLLSDATITTLVVEHRDRLTRFGFEYIEAALSAQHRSVLVLNQEEVQDDLVQDMIEVLTAFCARLYGRRSAKRRVQKGLEAIQHAD